MSDINQQLNKITEKLAKARQMGMNRAAQATRTDMKRIIRSVYNVQSSKITDSIKIKRMTKRNADVAFDVRQSPLGLISFNARQTKRGVRYEIIKGMKQEMLHAFIATINGGRQVFKRVGTKDKRKMVRGRYAGRSLRRQKIEKMVGPSIAQMIISTRYGGKITDEVKKKFAEMSSTEILRAYRAL